MNKLLVTPQGYEILQGELDKLHHNSPGYDIKFVGGQIADKSVLIDELKKVDGCIIGAEPIDKEVLDSCPNLQILSRFGVGYNNIDIKETNKRGIKVCNVPTVNAHNVARHCLSMMLSLTNNILLQKSHFRNKKWIRDYNISPKYATVGIVGAGSVGKSFGTLCKALGYDIKYFKRGDNILDFISQSDIISLHLKSTNLTNRIINRECIDAMKNKYFINTARADLVDNDYLFEKISTFKGVGLDVFENEPTVNIPSNVLDSDNVVLTCHTSSYDRLSVEEVGVQAINNVIHFFNNDFNKVNSFVDLY